MSLSWSKWPTVAVGLWSGQAYVMSITFYWGQFEGKGTLMGS